MTLILGTAFSFKANARFIDFLRNICMYVRIHIFGQKSINMALALKEEKYGQSKKTLE